MKNATSRVYSKMSGSTNEISKSQSTNLVKWKVAKIVIRQENSNNNCSISQVPFPWRKEYLNTKENQSSFYGPLILRKPLSSKSSFVESDPLKLQANAIEVHSKFNPVKNNVETRNQLIQEKPNSDYFQSSWISGKNTNTSDNTMEQEKVVKAEEEVNEYFSCLQWDDNYQSRGNTNKTNEDATKRGKSLDNRRGRESRNMERNKNKITKNNQNTESNPQLQTSIIEKNLVVSHSQSNMIGGWFIQPEKRTSKVEECKQSSSKTLQKVIFYSKQLSN